MAKKKQDGTPVVISEDGSLGPSVYLRSTNRKLGRAGRRAAELAQHAVERMQAAEEDVKRVEKGVRDLDYQAKYAQKKYGRCKCGRIIVPQNMRHRILLDKAIESGSPIRNCHFCFLKTARRRGKAKFAILKMRGKNPRIVEGRLLVDP